MSQELPTVIVLAPDVLVRSFEDPVCARLLVAWRDRRIRPALNRELLRVYLQALQKLGVQAVSLRRWAWWFTAPDRVRFLETEEFSPETGRKLCTEVAKIAEAVCVVGASLPVSGSAAQGEPGSDQAVPWMTPEEFLDAEGLPITR